MQNREFKHDVYGRRQTTMSTSDFLLNHTQKRKTSPTIHRKYKYFHFTVQTAKDGRQKFHFCRLPSDVTSCLISLMLNSRYRGGGGGRGWDSHVEKFGDTRGLAKGWYSQIFPSLRMFKTKTPLFFSRQGIF